jgi:RNA-directed DNA polymerase
MSIFTYEKLYRAYLDCRKTKRKTANALKFELNFEDNLLKLLGELRARTYRPGRSICFVVTEPTPREIFAADFRDRITHHLLVREVHAFFERRFIFDSYACRPGKGTHRAVKRQNKFMHKLIGGARQRQSGCYMQLDVSSFFMSIDHNILYSIFEKNILKNEELSGESLDEILWLGGLIIFHRPAQNYIMKGRPELFELIPPRKSLRHQPAGRGLPIGNYTSQFFANLYLNELDHFVKRELKCGFYIRYVDDFVILGRDGGWLKYCRDRIGEFLKRTLKLELNLNKSRTQLFERGLDFLGYFLKPQKIYVRRKVVKRYRNKLWPIAIGCQKVETRSLLGMAHSYAGHFKHAR